MKKSERAAPAILIADADGQAELAPLLEAEGYRAVEARDGREALRWLESGKIAAALIDDRLVEPGWLEILSRLRELDAAVPVVLLSSANTARQVAQAMQRGARNFLLRPVVPSDLFEALRDALGEHDSTGPHFEPWETDPCFLVPFEDRQRRARRLEAFGRLTGGVVHDFNNLLTVIAGYAQLLQRGLDQHSPLRSFVEEILRATEHGTALTRQLLTFGRAEPRATVFSLKDVVRQTERMLLPLLGNQVELVWELAADPCPVELNPGQLEQILVNLAINARDAMPQGGQLTLRTVNDPSAEEVALVVADTGSGMDAATQARLFEPFFTTKPPGQGTGLGLTTVHRVVAQAGGRIEVASAPGRGTTFTVTLPRAEEPPAQRPPVPETLRARGIETVLLVESDLGVRSLLRRTLALAGYHVLEADDGPAALALASDFPGRIDLLVTEATLPRATGPEIYQQLRVGRTSLLVLFSTSSPGNGRADQLPAGAEPLLLVKPFTAEVLLTRIREVLEGRQTAVTTS